MPLILAIEPDRRQATQLKAVVRGRLHAELVLADSAESALAALGDRVPDLVLTSAFLSSKDEALLAERLRALDAAAAHVQTLTIPVLDAPRPPPNSARGMLSVLLRDRGHAPAAPDGCDPAIFADQCAAYLERAADERSQTTRDQLVDAEPLIVEEPVRVETLPVVREPDAQAAELALPPSPELRRTAVAQSAEDSRQAQGERSTPVQVAIEPAERVSERLPDPPAEPLPPSAHGEPFDPLVLSPSKDEPAQDPDSFETEAEPDSTPVFELDLSTLLDESVVHELSAAIENVTAADPGRWAQRRAKPRADTWTPVPIGNKTPWPRMDGKCSEGSQSLHKDADAVARSKRNAGTVRPKRTPKARPVQDDWGLFDPAQCGFATLLAKLDEITKMASPLPDESSSAGSPGANH